MASELKARIKQAMSARRRSFVLRVGRRLAEAYIAALENSNYLPRYNGEEWLVSQLATMRLSCIVDVGANVGDWAAMAHRYSPSADIHCFEVVPSTCSTLATRFDRNHHFRVHCFGLGNREGEVVVNHYPKRSTLSSLVGPIHGDSEVEVVAGAVRAGDSLCHLWPGEIDLLKIDVEGYEYQVLQGFSATLDSKKIKVIQFEYGRAYVHCGALLRDVWVYLESKGYILGKLFPRGVAFSTYSDRFENFIGPNFVAVRSTDSNSIDLLRERS